MSDPASPPRETPGTVVGAIVLTGFHAVLSIAFPPWGWLWAGPYIAGSVGLALGKRWAYWLVVVMSALSWVLALAGGRVDVISTNLAVIALLMTPSARKHFGVGRSGLGYAD